MNIDKIQEAIMTIKSISQEIDTYGVMPNAIIILHPVVYGAVKRELEAKFMAKFEFDSYQHDCFLFMGVKVVCGNITLTT